MDGASVRRIRATRPQAVRKHGRVFGGKRRYGRESDGSVRASEAKVVREIAARFLEGVSVRLIARDLDAAGVPTASGGRWRGTGIDKMLKRPDLAGLVQIEGELVEGSVTPILSRDVWSRVQAVYAARRTGEPRGRRPAGVYLLDKPLEVRCSCCGGRMRPRTVHRRGRRPLFRYVCANRAAGAACPMPRIPRAAVDSVHVPQELD